MLSPTVWDFRARVIFFTVGLDVFFVVISNSYAFFGYPATSAGTKSFIAFRSALLPTGSSEPRRSPE
ncbi:MAG: hypothetical protein HY235_17745 [Acidobacteria bacterium]|nr:hypothetical protein [Acidobacteriota bacterium]